MNKRQLEVQKVNLDNEQKILKELKQVYTEASEDCVAKIQALSGRTDMENLQSIIYQKQYQEALKKQLDAVIEQLNGKAFTSVSQYITTAYEDGFFGTMYDLQGQGIPLCFPINQEEVVQAIQTNSQISKGLYSRMGEDVDLLKKSIRTELSRGVANGESWNQLASHIAKGMNSPFQKAYNRTVTIARTEGHRVQQEATLHCQKRAKSKGADVVKQWDSTLDGSTRPTHVALDGQIRELDEYFDGGGGKAMHPGGFGVPSEDCNCRCCLLQRARWALSDEEYYSKWDGEKKELVSIPAKSYNEFKKEAKDTVFKMDLKFFGGMSSEENSKKISTFLNDLKSGKINTKLKWGKQRDHIDGTKENVKRILDDIKDNNTPVSILYSDVDVKILFEKLSGTGEVVFRPGQLYPIEYVDAPYTIGKVYNLGKQEYDETNRIAIQYSSKGYHIFPVKGV